MKRLLAIGALLLAPTGCVSNQGDSLIRFLGARGINSTAGACAPEANSQISAGLVDISARTGYLIAPSVETNIFQQDVSVGQTPVSGSGLNDVTLQELVYSYELAGTAPAGLTLKEEVVPVYAVFRPQTDPDESYMFLSSLGPLAVEALYKYYVSDDPGARPKPETIVLSKIKARGYVSSGGKVESNIFVFPTTVRDYVFKGCPADSEFIFKCGRLGQDGPISCEDKGT